MMEYCYLGLQDRIILRHVQLTFIPASLQDARELMFQGWAWTDWGGVVAIKSLSRTVVVFN
jgi:hypothetical protein